MERLAIPVLIVSIVYAFMTADIVSEGHIGVYYRGAALMKGIVGPGLHFKFPFLTSLHEVQITIQTDEVRNIPCGTSGGVMINFGRVEVVNRLKKEHAWDTIKNYSLNYDKTWVFDKIHHEINQFCSSHSLREIYISKFDLLDDHLKEALQKGCEKFAPGIEIISVRTTKPQVPLSVMKNFKDLELKRNRLKLSQIENDIKVLDDKHNRDVSLIEAEGNKKIAEMELSAKKKQQEFNKKVHMIDVKIEQQKVEISKKLALKKAEFQKKINDLKSNKVISEYNKLVILEKLEKVYFVKTKEELLN